MLTSAALRHPLPGSVGRPSRRNRVLSVSRAVIPTLRLSPLATRELTSAAVAPRQGALDEFRRRLPTEEIQVGTPPVLLPPLPPPGLGGGWEVAAWARFYGLTSRGGQL